jgi:hypothetical protein
MEFYMPRLLFITSKLISLKTADFPPSLQHFHGYYEIGPTRGSSFPVTNETLVASTICLALPHCTENAALQRGSYRREFSAHQLWRSGTIWSRAVFRN